MGAESSKNQETEAEKLFSSEEKRRLQIIFDEITDKSHFGLLSHLQKYLSSGLPQDVTQRIYSAMVKFSNVKQDGFTLTGLSTFLSHMFKGTLTDKTKLVLSLASTTDQVSGTSLLEFVSGLISSYIKAIHQSEQFCSWKFNPHDKWVTSLSHYLLLELFQSGKDPSTPTPPGDRMFTEADVEVWLSRCPLFLHILDLVFHSCFSINQSEEFTKQVLTPMIPAVNKVNWSKTETILDVPSLMLLSHSLPGALRGEWRPLFSNLQHGDSFSQLQTRILKQGPTVIVVRDKDGQEFGGFASVGWDLRPQFVGTPTCFLFSLSPQFNVYGTTGYNDHYMYLNHGVQTMPNGLGMGGQLEYFGLWIDQTFNSGHSKAGPRCTTYGSPQLSKSPDFQVDIIEVWGVGPEPKVEPEEDARTSILDKDPEAKAMLSLIDRGPVSDGLREGDATADIPEEHELPPL